MIDDGVLSAFTQLFESAGSPAWIASADGETLVANAAFARRHGLDSAPCRSFDARLLLSVSEQDALKRIAAALQGAASDRAAPHVALGGCAQRYSVTTIRSNEQGTVFLLGQVSARVPVRESPTGEEAIVQERRSHARLRMLVDSAPGALFEFRENADGTKSLPYFSDKFPRIIGVDAAKLREDSDLSLETLQPEDAEQVQWLFAESRRTMQDLHGQFRIDHPQHGERWLMCSAIPVPERDGSITWFGNILDVTERVLTRAAADATGVALEEAHKRLTTIADNAPAGIFELYRDAAGNASLRYCSARMRALFGFDGAVPDTFFLKMRAQMRPRDFTKLHSSMERSRAGMTQWNHRFRFEHPTRGALWLSGSATPNAGEDGSVTWIGTIHDVTLDVKREEDLRRAKRLAESMRARSEWQVFHDPLTNLANRRYFDKILAQRRAAAKAADSPQSCTLVRVDGDRFKYVNDTLGHEAGDAVLHHIGRILLRALNRDDLAARIGGDEFALLLAPGSGEAEAEALTQQIKSALEQPFIYQGRRCQVEASFGIAHIADLAQDGEDLLYFADAALFRAKEKGRNRSELFTPALKAGILEDRKIAADLQGALDRDEFVPFFQPQICAISGKLHGIETLLRWQHPKHGLLAPDRFLRVADQLRIVPDLDGIMLRKAGALLKDWRAQGLIIPKIAFNVSSGRMRDPEILDAAEAILSCGTKVAFELLESILVEEEGDIFRFHLDQLREAGIEIEIDDFGSGHASVIALMAISPNALKIDRRLIQPVDVGDRHHRLVHAIVEIAESFGIYTIAEGVETEDQATLLRDLGCDVLQGYHFSRPVSADNLVCYINGLTKKAARDGTG
ncbi:EAL domain-containing protein [Primorskyibacter sp. 2E107]|uniref:sensor domain-containing protein n=1 Tax=Primorskyibacter sp. 2E107 TaxID=3403458 RepID=UPI003AF74C09